MKEPNKKKKPKYNPFPTRLTLEDRLSEGYNKKIDKVEKLEMSAEQKKQNAENRRIAKLIEEKKTKSYWFNLSEHMKVEIDELTKNLKSANMRADVDRGLIKELTAENKRLEFNVAGALKELKQAESEVGDTVENLVDNAIMFLAGKMKECPTCGKELKKLRESLNAIWGDFFICENNHKFSGRYLDKSGHRCPDCGSNYYNGITCDVCCYVEPDAVPFEGEDDSSD